MNISLKKLTLDYFKGIHSLEIDFHPDTTNIYGANGTGKSTVKDAFCWLLFGKDTQGRADYAVKTYGPDGKIIPQIDHTVTATLSVDGRETVLVRTLHEKWVKKRGAAETSFEGNETLYQINGLPVQAGEYKAYIDSLISDEMFKALTNPLFVNTLPWKSRRDILTSLVSVTDQDIARENEQFRRLLDTLNGTDLALHARMLAERRKELKKELDTIPTRIDEAMRSMPADRDYTAVESEIARTEKELAQAETLIADKSKANQAVFDAKKQRQEAIFALQSEILAIEFNANGEAAISLCEANAERRKAEAEKKSLQSELTTAIERSAGIESEIQTLEDSLNKKRNEWTRENEREASFDDIAPACPTCGRLFSPEEIEGKRQSLLEKFNLNKQSVLESIDTDGKRLKERIGGLSQEKQKADERIGELKELIREKEMFLSEHPEINVGPIYYPERYEDAKKELQSLEKDESAPAEIDFSELTDRKKELSATLDTLKKELSAREAAEKIDRRVEQLNDRQKELAQLIAAIEKDEYTVEQFNRAKIERLDELINAHFTTIQFRLFDHLNDGTPVECCEAMIHGAPYGTANDAAKLNAGLEIIGVLSRHYGLSAPIFIDNRESVTDIVPMPSQIINLFVSPQHQTLTVE